MASGSMWMSVFSRSDSPSLTVVIGGISSARKPLVVRNAFICRQARHVSGPGMALDVRCNIDRNAKTESPG